MSAVRVIGVRGFVRGSSKAISIGIVLGSLAAFGWVASGAIHSADSLTHVRLLPFLGAIALHFGMLVLLMLLWGRLLGFLFVPRGGGHREPDQASLYTAYSRSWLARYIPGRIWSFGGRMMLASNTGVPAEAVARSMVFEVLFSYGIVTILGTGLIVAARVHLLAGAMTIVLGLFALAASIPLAHRALAAGNNSEAATSSLLWSKIRRRAHRLLVGTNPLPLRTIVWAIAAYGLYSSLQLVFIVLIARSFVDLTLLQGAIIAGAWGLSITLGWLSFLAPVGLGVRDGLAFVLFAQVLDPASASLIVVASRTVMIATDVAFVGAVELLAFGLNIKQSQPQTSP